MIQCHKCLCGARIWTVLAVPVSSEFASQKVTWRVRVVPEVWVVSISPKAVKVFVGSVARLLSVE